MGGSGKGLEGVVAAETALSDIDGKEGRLWYVGYDIHDLANHSTFEEIIYLLQNLELPNASQLEQLRVELGGEREPNAFAMQLIPPLANNSSPMSMLRTTCSASSARDPDGWHTSPEANLRKAIRLCAVFPTFVAYFDRLRNGLDLIPPDPSLSQAANFLYMLKGEKADYDAARIFRRPSDPPRRSHHERADLRRGRVRRRCRICTLQ